MSVPLRVILVLIALPALMGGLLVLDNLFGLAYGLITVLFEGTSLESLRIRHARTPKYP